jgi:hypothetical protein
MPFHWNNVYADRDRYDGTSVRPGFRYSAEAGASFGAIP